jgi:CO/xanthine dehydrogenase FAD-binding subunit
LLPAVSAVHIIDGIDINISASIGVTGVPATSPSRVTLADNALKNAQSKAQDAAAALSKANAAISQAQSVRGRCGLSITPSR